MLFGREKEWIKKGTGLFDVTMGCFDVVEKFQLVFPLRALKAYTGRKHWTTKRRWPWCILGQDLKHTGPTR